MDTREYWRAFLIAQGFAEENVMRNIRRALLLTAGLLVMLSLGLPALAVEPPRADFDLGTEAFGPLRIGLPAEELQWLLGDWKQLSEPALWAADGLEHWEAGYELLGITVGLAREPGDGTGAFVSSVLATGPREWKTARGAGIGDPVEIVVSLYADAIDPLWNSNPSREILIGSLYGGMLVSLENGLVVSLYLDAMAE